MAENTPEEKTEKSKDFIRNIIDTDLAAGKNEGRVETRFPPEPNGYLHIGHAKSICLNFGIAADYKGVCHLRFDDTNPEKEEQEYVDSIQQDVKWLGFDWGKHLYYASDYYDKCYEYALELINKGLAYVCDLSPDEVREHRGTPTAPGKNSPYRNRSVKENLELFEKMRSGEFPEGKCLLRAKIDMAHPNINMRDPALYRIKKVRHDRTGDKWCIYPMYDYAHPISDALENITHSICTLEFEDHRPLYDWVLDNISIKAHPRQVEFARLNMTYTVLSKRKLLQLVNDGNVSGWDDPRMPTISGLRRRGYTAEAIRNFCDRIGVDKTNSTIDVALLEYFIREDLNKKALRAMAVLRPLKVVIDNYPEGRVEEFDAENNPEDPAAGSRKVLFSRELYIEQEDFKEVPPKGYFRLSPGAEVRLKHAYYITCTGFKKDEKTGEINEVHCQYDPQSRGGGTPDNRKVKGTLHWVSAAHAVDADARLYERLFNSENPDNVPEGGDFKDNLNANSLELLKNCKLEKSLAEAKPGQPYQFLRNAYFCLDRDSSAGKLVFNRTVTLRDSWAKMENKSAKGKDR
ncbi:MAG TPA: glutamine--tRNA ligase [Elusimicrobia bacterium]|nr:MAG: glutamine--tRNA ligase [Elusimicrobia bacterium RIFOXYA12_FULL_49_49]OGS14934.1 MAG: glutamine--tRNA ligase [Elusimicrobia bacterium RIFOXYA2_FULL_47_53]OGS26131.1 MAG: glutamine--tRNA ligase [Elusimicrobia bacterium RIFOXYB12_FULL_50_12]OGS29279.1 MAG: glutamine--tRNA ligase [Elusimicrobia bacterium RIFOXYB2_FULL_46_23]HBU70375.1 glutamine--tRNA ligase [Elusimicrobiota bacterium]